MTRINTNVSSLVAQNTLARSHSSLNQALTRLSTGLRINSGQDDPAGLIASENLRSDITSIQGAISNTAQANEVIGTADSALGQVSSLLNDIRGLVTQSANTGALSADQIAANQLQVDSSLKALNRIAQTTTFQGRRLLDGSLDFITTAGSGFGTVSDLKIDTANLGSTGSVSVAVNIASAATQAKVTNGAITTAVSPASASATLTFTDAATAATGNVTIATVEQEATGSINYSTTAAAGLTLTAKAGGAAAGAAGAASGGIDLVLVDSNDASGNVNSVAYNAGSNTLTVTADLTGGVTEDAVATAIAASGGGNDFTATAVATTALVAGDAGTYADVTAGGQDAGSQSIAVTANSGTAGNNLTFAIVETNGTGATPAVTNVGNAYTIHVDDTVATSISAIATAIAGITGVASATTTSTASYNPTIDTVPGSAATLSGGTAGGSDAITVTADTAGADTHTVSLVEAAGHGAATAAFDGSGNIVVTVDDTATTSISSIASAINGLAGYSASVAAGGTGNGSYIGASDTPPSNATLAGGVAASGGLDSDIVFELSGATGADVLSFGAGTGISTIVAAINSGSDSTGVSAVNNAGTLELTSTAYGSKAFVNVKVLSGDDNGTFAGGLQVGGAAGSRGTGTDISASVNGIQASGDGNKLSINTASLDLSLTVNAGSSTAVNFTINGGGALFQLGPEVVSNQQARIGITSVNTAKLGGTDGKLFQLGSGGVADLDSDPTKAASIVDEAINQITSLRGRLGAFQRTSLETNKNALNDTLVNLTDAQSNIRDADFATETANLTRAQILVQSGTTVLQISNSSPQNVLALLRQ
jgi:flagellin